MKKKIIATLLCASMVATLFTGCGKEEGTTTDPGAAVPEGGTETSDAAATDGEVVKLRMMAYNAESSRASYLKYLDEKLPNIEIEFEFVSQDNFDNVLNSQLQACEGPDIMELGG